MDDEGLMRRALAEAEHAASHGDVPVGALVVVEGEVIAARHNERQLTTDPTAHAEILAMRDACEYLGTWRLDNATLVTTLEPCVMCAGALVNARIQRVVFGAPDLEAGAPALSTTSAPIRDCATTSRSATTSSETSAPNDSRHSSPASYR